MKKYRIAVGTILSVSAAAFAFNACGGDMTGPSTDPAELRMAKGGPNAAPTADAGGPYTGHEGAAVAFSGSGTGPGLKYSWEFGDGGTSTAQKPQYAYASDGTYVVVLTVTNNKGLTGKDTTGATIANVAPTANLTLSASTVTLGQSVSATGSFTDPGANDSPWAWEIDWGDGSTKLTGSATTQSASISGSRSYGAAGTYTVRLSVTDKDGGKGTREQSVTVSTSSTPPPPPPPDAESQFTDFGSYTTGAKPHDWSTPPPYQTGDYRVEARAGATGGKVLYHSFTIGGRYLLKWDAVADRSNVDLTSVMRLINGTSTTQGLGLVARGSVTSRTYYATRLDGQGRWQIIKSVDDATVYRWGSVPNPIPHGTWGQQRFMVKGDTVRAKFWVAGTQEPATWTISAIDPDPLPAGFVGIYMRYEPATAEYDWFRFTSLEGPSSNQPPVASFVSTADGLEATFTDKSTDSDGTVVAWDWDFGDGTRATNRNPIHTYAVGGSYSVRLTVTDNLLGTHSKTQSVSVSSGGSTKVLLVGAGDIARCSSDRKDGATADLLDRFPAATVFTAGDNAYEHGTLQQYTDCYHPTWGRHKARTLPTAGNHEYYTTNAAGHYAYFGSAAGDPDKGYYSYTLGSWLIIALNSELSMTSGSPQEAWLRQTLTANPRQCTLAYWHHPRFSSVRGDNADKNVTPLWEALYAHGADVVINGHDHAYERFAPKTPSGGLDLVRGIRQFTVGTGGVSLYNFGTTSAYSEVRRNDTHGVIKMTLGTGQYTWEFIPVAGKSFTDSGSEPCR